MEAPINKAALEGAGNAAGEEESKPVTWRSWWIVAVLVLLNIFSWLDRQVIVMLIDPIKHDLGISEVQISLLIGFSFALLYAVCGIPLGFAADKFQRRLVIFFGVLFWSVSTVLCGFARGFGSLFVARLGVGVGEAALIPASYSILSDTFPPKRMGVPSALMASGSAVGIALSFLIAGIISASVAHGGTVTIPLLGEFRAWQVPFIVVGLPGPLLALLVFTFREPKRKGKAAPAPSSSGASSPANAPGFVSYMKEYWRFYFFHIGAMSCTNIGYFAYVSWSPAYLSRVHEWTPIEIGAIFGTLQGISILTGQLLGGTSADYFYARGMKDAHLRLYAFAALIIIPIYAIGILSNNAYVFLGALMLSTVIMLGNSAAGLAAMQFMTPNDYRGRILGIHMFIANFLGLGVGPTFVGAITQYWFQDMKAVGYSLLITTFLIYPLTAWMFWKGAKCMRDIHEKRGM